MTVRSDESTTITSVNGDRLGRNKTPVYLTSLYTHSKAPSISQLQHQARRSPPSSSSVTVPFRRSYSSPTVPRTRIDASSKLSHLASRVAEPPLSSRLYEQQQQRQYSAQTTPRLVQQSQNQLLADMDFYGLPLEILQHIATFLPFHDLIRVYKSMPKVYRPIFQQQLERSLALMVLTLEIQQPSPESAAVVTVLVDPSALSPAAAGATALKTQWRATHFDLESLRVEFELEDKLGLEMAERRHQEILQQHYQRQQQQQQLQHQLHAPPSAASTLYEDIETVIWKARRRAFATSRRIGLQFAMNPDTAATTSSSEELDPCHADYNFFHCDQSSSLPVLGSATVTFKAHRNTMAPWVVHGADPPLAPSFSKPPSSTTTSAPAESPWTQSARERIAAFQQNRVLIKTLAKLRNQDEASKLQFLPRIVELDISELGQKRAKAVVVDHHHRYRYHHHHHHRYTAWRWRRHHVTSKRPITSLSSTTATTTTAATTTTTSSSSSSSSSPPPLPPRMQRRHSWHPIESFESHRSAFLFVEDEYGESSAFNFSTIFKRFLKVSSWNEIAPLNWLTAQEDDEKTEECECCEDIQGFAAMAAAAAASALARAFHPTTAMTPITTITTITTMTTMTDWTSLFTNVVASVYKMHRHYRRFGFNSSGSVNNIVVTTTLEPPKGVTKRRFSQSHQPSLDVSSSSAAATAERATTKEQTTMEQHHDGELFEFLYDVRHNYLSSSRLEGERVIRPLRFACSLDFFIQREG
ncbi:hypothetical protein BGZ98_007126 [Dissophora globulifera]|nr:hypothetical protein BGZ98_007126 [Dissophora globulifera]